MNFIDPAPAEVLLVEVAELLRTMPNDTDLVKGQSFDWMGRCAAVLARWDPLQVVKVETAIRAFGSGTWPGMKSELLVFKATLHRAFHDLQMRTSATSSTVVGKGDQFNYFDVVRKVIEKARTELFFIDPYLDADFVARYLPYVASGTKVRLLARERMAKLAPAVQVMGEQQRLSIELRSGSNFHDRYLFVDGNECYSSSGSFGSGGRQAPTVFTSVLDNAPVIRKIYEDIWTAGTPK